MTRRIEAHLLPRHVSPEQLRGGVAVVIDVLRATTTIVHALAAGCTAVIPVLEVEEARRLKSAEANGKVLLGGERGGKAPEGFDLGNSPWEYTPQRCRGRQLILTTTNGTRAIHAALPAERILLAAFVNFTAVAEQLLKETRPIHLMCAGTDDDVTLEDALLAGALVEVLCEGTCQPPPRLATHRRTKTREVLLNDSARLVWDCFEHHGMVLEETLRLSQGGANLVRIGHDRDIQAAARVDQFALVPEVLRDPLRIEVGAVGMVHPRWPISRGSSHLQPGL
ncbi:MAG: 2-phosphosulfolactate phosphatase [Gemmatales bacterium]|nr:2-phosphosulfolactate phosphatase [Gemmatales bacterium]MDW8386306.1 2-phosphosulfolactate phosphatase [Gemmatales bacterium]